MASALGVLTTVNTLTGLLNDVSLTLGSIEFTDMEVPETIGPLGGNQRLAIHEFPGGVRTAQPFGAFAEAIGWRGILRGGSALDRAAEIDRLRVTGERCGLQYAGFGFIGHVSFFHCRPRNQWYVPYEIMFEPVEDIAGGNTPASAGESPEASLTDQTTALDGYQNGSPLPTPPTMTGPVGSLLTDVGGALQQANGVVSNVIQSAQQLITSDVAAVINAASPIIASISSLAAIVSPALDIISRARIIGYLINGQSALNVPIQVRTINPNLMDLSAQYYQDATKWRLIGNANGISDPQPIGVFLLTIPRIPNTYGRTTQVAP